MKIKHIGLVILLFTIVFSGCKKVEDALEVTFDTTLTKDLNIDVPGDTKSGVTGTFDESVTIDPNDDANFAEYKEMIKNIEVSEVTGKITSVTNGDFNVSNLNITVGTAQWTFANVAVTQGASLTLDNANGQWDTIKSLLNGKEAFTATATGTTDKDDVKFTIQIKIKAKVTANPL